MSEDIRFRFARESDCRLILKFIRSLARYEKLSDEVVATEELLREWLFEKKKAEVIFALAQIAEARGCGRLEWSCLDWNQPSIDFYKSLGAVAMDEWTVYRVSGDALKAMAGREEHAE